MIKNYLAIIFLVLVLFLLGCQAPQLEITTTTTVLEETELDEDITNIDELISDSEDELENLDDTLLDIEDNL